MTAREVVTPTDGQALRFDEIVKEATEHARKELLYDKEAMQRFIGNSGQFNRDVFASIIKHANLDNNFLFYGSFAITAPSDYNHETQLAEFVSLARKGQNNFYNCHPYIDDKNFSKTTHVIIPNRTYLVKKIGPRISMKAEDCLLWLKDRGAKFFGAQGLTLAYQLAKDSFPEGKCVVSLDEKENFPEQMVEDCVVHHVPRIFRCNSGEQSAGLTSFETNFNHGDCLLAFFD